MLRAVARETSTDQPIVVAKMKNNARRRFKETLPRASSMRRIQHRAVSVAGVGMCTMNKDTYIKYANQYPVAHHQKFHGQQNK